MTIDTLLDFDSRVDEIDKYYKFLKDLEGDPILYYEEKSTHRRKEIDEDMLKIMKASFFLMIYNMAESTIYNAMTDLSDAISSETVKYKDVIEEIKQNWIKKQRKTYFENKKNAEIVQTIGNIAEDIITISFTGNELSGNTSATNIGKLARAYGFSISTHHTCKNGRELNNVKDKRNLLAHGNISFRDCGKDYTVEDLNLIRRQVVTYLRGILKNIKKYINEKHYLD